LVHDWDIVHAFLYQQLILERAQHNKHGWPALDTSFGTGFEHKLIRSGLVWPTAEMNASRFMLVVGLVCVGLPKTPSPSLSASSL
jgi:hypothetical protein